MAKEYVCPRCLNKFEYGNFWFQCAKFSEKSESVHEEMAKKIRETQKKFKGNAEEDVKADSKECKKVREDMCYPEQKVYGRNDIAQDCTDGYFKDLAKSKGKKVPDSAKCYYCNEEASVHICPKCHQKINIDENSSQYIINLAGAKSSGKSDFLGSLLYMIKEKFSNVVNGWHIDFDKNANDYYKDFITRVKEKTPVATKEGEKSIPATITFKKNMGEYTKQHSFILYDIAGEALTKEMTSKERARRADKFSRPDCIIYLCDPARMDGPYNDAIKKTNIDSFTMEFLTGTGDVHLETRDDNERNQTYIAKIREFLTDIMFYKHKLSKKEAEKKTNIPVAVCLTMLDVLKNIYTENERSHRPYFVPSDYVETYKVKEYIEKPLANKSENLKKQMQIWGEDGFINYLDANFGETRYFGISALGTSNDELSDDLRRDFRPINVLDPVVWFISLVADEIFEGNTPKSNISFDFAEDHSYSFGGNQERSSSSDEIEEMY